MIKLGIGSDIARTIVTEQLIWGFQYLFGLDDFSFQIRTEPMLQFLKESPHVATRNGISPMFLAQAGTRLERMYKELLEVNYEYAYDEYGEFLLDEIIMVLGNTFPSAGDWPKVGTYALRKILYAECLNQAEEDALDIGGDYNPYEEGELLYQAVTYLPTLAHDGGYEYILFCDSDFKVFRGCDAMQKVEMGITSQKYNLSGELVR